MPKTNEYMETNLLFPLFNPTVFSHYLRHHGVHILPVSSLPFQDSDTKFMVPFG